jgi:MFS family permease
MPPAAWGLFAGTFVNRLGTFVFPFMTLYLTRRGYSAAQAGGAVAMYGLGGIGSQLVGGLVTDRIGRRNTIALSMLAASGLTLVLWRASTLATVYPMMAMLAFVAEMHRPAASALIADVVPSERRVTAFALLRFAINIGWATGLALGGFLADRSFAYLFVGDAITSSAFGLVSVAVLPHGTRTTRGEERRLPAATRAILADRGFLLFLGSILVGSAIYTQNVSTFPLHVRDAGFSNAVYGGLQSLNGLIIVLVELPITAWARRHPRTRMVALGGVLVGAAFASLLVARAIPALVAMVVVWTLGEMVASPATSAFVADRSPEHARGRYQAALGTMFALGAIVGPLVGSATYGVSPDALWIGCGLAGLVSGALALAAGSPRPVDTRSSSG